MDTMFDVALSSEAFTSDRSRDTCLGAVVLSPSSSLNQLRSHIVCHLSAVPTDFCFLSSRGSQLNKLQEDTIQIQDVLTDERTVRIQRIFEKPRVGLKIQNGFALGFVFIDHSSPVSVLREAVQTQAGVDIIFFQLGHISGTGNVEYQFLDRNSWPIRNHQEADLTVIDILVCGSVSIVPSVSSPFNSSCVLTDGTHETQDKPPAKRRRLSLVPQLTFTSNKDQFRRGSLDSTDNGQEPKQVLISYVRAEAAQHASRLKCKLVRLGFSVYLDVHEIKSGVDWQDSLNFAVSNCEVFVPLITSRYGETQWTNREVKLADVLAKEIIPICFLDHWPPRSLAIQFATTQYIPWKTPDDIRREEERGNKNSVWDIKHWDDGCVAEAARKIAEKIELSERQLEDISEDDLLDSNENSTQVPLKRKRTSSLINMEGPLMDNLSQKSANDKYRVVISVHPKQHQFGMELKALLEGQRHEVWCSSESCDMSSLHSNGESDLFDDDGTNCEAALGTAGTSAPITRNDSSSTYDLCLSQTLSQPVVELGSKDQEQQKVFQGKADNADVIIVVLSKAFATSQISRQQVFYCEHRKRVIPLRYDEFCMPTWMSMLIGTGVIEDVKSKNYQKSLLKRLECALNPDMSNGETHEVDENHITKQVKQLKQKMPKQLCIYIAGSSKFYHKQTDEICKRLGEKLAQVDNILLVTGGFTGVGEAVALSYTLGRKKSQKPSTTWHVLPERDEEDKSDKAKQRSDKTFERIGYGETVFSGNSVREREIIAARAFDICVLIEGGPGAAHEAEQFVWNDHVVIPLRCTGGAATGKFNVPQQIFDIPPGVSEMDWETLGDKAAAPEALADSVVRVVESLRERIKMDSPSPDYTRIKVPPLRKTGSFSRKKSSDLTRMKTLLLKSPPAGSTLNKT